jgi:hypothetical protein
VNPGRIERHQSCVAFIFLLASTAITSPDAVAQTRLLTPLASIDGPAQLIQVQDRSLYVIADRTLRIVDLEAPQRPQAVGAFTFPEHIRAFAVSGTHMYALADFHGIRILDLSTPALPVLRGSFPLRGGYFGVALFNATTLLVTGLSSGLQIIDVSDVNKPVLLASQFTDGYAQGIAILGGVVYIMDDPTGLYMFDLSTPRAPVSVGLLDVNAAQPDNAGAVAGLSSHAVAVAGPAADRSIPIAAVLDKTGGSLAFFSVSNPASPVRLGQLRVPLGAQNVVTRASVAYIAGGMEGLQIVDFSNPSKPVHAGAYKAMHPVVDVSVSEPFVFVASGPGGVTVLRAGQ